MTCAQREFLMLRNVLDLKNCIFFYSRRIILIITIAIRNSYVCTVHLIATNFNCVIAEQVATKRDRSLIFSRDRAEIHTDDPFVTGSESPWI